MLTMSRDRRLAEPETLTGRELRVLKLMATGLTYDEIAARMRRSPETVKAHERTIRRKLGAKNGPNAVAIAYRLGILGG
jgi:DNA-binding CsgD family transcriptional regulator